MPLTNDCQRNLCNELPERTVLSEQCSFKKTSMAPKKKMRRNLNAQQKEVAQMKESFSLESIHYGESSDLDESESEECDSDSEDSSDDIEKTYQLYRLECEHLVRSSAAMGKEKHISALESLVRDLIEQNQCLVKSIGEIKHESALRVKEMRRRLQKSAARTEEVMLALASHELYLKKFVEQHCCSCCGCDMRLMHFKLCHRDQCDDNQPLTHITFPNRCRSYGHEWNSIISNTSNWFARKRPLLSGDCLHNLPSQIRFTSLVDKIDSRIHQLEVENEEVKHENELIRELNSMLSGRNGPPLTITHCRNDLSVSESMYRVHPIDHDSLSLDPCAKGKKEDIGMSGLHTEDLITFLGESGQTDMFSNYLYESLELRDGFDSCGGSRSDSLNGRHDNDSGCSTDLIPSQTDMNSLLMSDCEDECEDLLRSALESIHGRTGKDVDTLSHHSATSACTDLEALRTRLSLAERLVPKLYSKLLYYLVQRNMLLRQFQQENRARQKCKQELSTLADSVAIGLKDIELSTKAIKQIQISSFSPPSMF